MATKANRTHPPAAMAIALTVSLAACGSPLRPFVQTVYQSQPEDRAKSTVTMVEVCYNRTTTTPEAVRKLAENVCVEKGAHAVFVKHRFLQCPLLQPSSANFACR